MTTPTTLTPALPRTSSPSSRWCSACADRLGRDAHVRRRAGLPRPGRPPAQPRRRSGGRLLAARPCPASSRARSCSSSTPTTTSPAVRSPGPWSRSSDRPASTCSTCCAPTVAGGSRCWPHARACRTTAAVRRVRASLPGPGRRRRSGHPRVAGAARSDPCPGPRPRGGVAAALGLLPRGQNGEAESAWCAPSSSVTSAPAPSRPIRTRPASASHARHRGARRRLVADEPRRRP